MCSANRTHVLFGVRDVAVRPTTEPPSQQVRATSISCCPDGLMTAKPARCEHFLLFTGVRSLYGEAGGWCYRCRRTPGAITAESSLWPSDIAHVCCSGR